MKNDNSATLSFRSMQDLSKEVNQMKEEEQEEDLRSRSDEGSSSYQQQRRLENSISPHRSTMPTFFGEGERCRNEERKEPETHETLSMYIEEYR